jgi:precorrin-3B C17-methyltransferase
MLSIVGIGPGDKQYLTLEALEVLQKSDIIAGYTVYVELVQKFLSDKEYYTTPMTKEKERCEWALAQAAKGKAVCMVCSGDSGIYGMASLIYELAEAYPSVEIQVISGITAACSGAAVLGAPLTHDFAVISLSDRLTPYELIMQRLRLSAEADLAIAIYNPGGKNRSDYLQKACDVLLEIIPSDRVCGYVKNIGRDGEEAHVLTLQELRDTKVDMFTTVFIGNAATRIINGKMVTPRGYQIG